MERVLPGQTLARAREVAAARRAAGVQELVLACEWADSHPPREDEPHPGRDPRAARREREAARLAEQRRVAADWLALAEPDTAAPYLASLDDEDVLPDPWLPDYAWDCVASFAAALGVSTTAGGRLTDEALFLRTRMPRLWARLLAGEVEAFRARRIAQTGWRQPADVVDALDLEATPRAHSMGVTGLDALVDEITLRLHAEARELDQIAALDHRHVTLHHEQVSTTGHVDLSATTDLADGQAFDRACSAVAHALRLRSEATGTTAEPFHVRRSRALGILADPAHAQALLAGLTGVDPAHESADALDPDRPLAPRIELVVHLTPRLLSGPAADGPEVSLGAAPTAWVGRSAGGGLRPQLTQAVAEWAGRPATQLTVQPVIDLNEHSSSDSTDVSDRMRRRTSLRRPTCSFPHCGRPAPGCDADHRVSADTGGATCDCNLHPLCRRHHRLKTFTGWTYVPLPPDDPHDTGPPRRYIWTNPHGMAFLVDDHGTRDLTPPGWDGCRRPRGGSRRTPG